MGIGFRGKTMPKIVKFALIGIIVCFVAIFCLAMLMIVIVLTSSEAPAFVPLVIGACSWIQTLY
jgi:type IV secretory pathway VirB6-like protein